MSTAAVILDARAEIAEPIAATCRNKARQGWSVEAITDYIQRMNPQISPEQVRQLLTLPH